MGVIFDILMSLLPGIGAATILDKVAADKVPNYPSGGIGPKNLVWFIAAAVAGAARGPRAPRTGRGLGPHRVCAAGHPLGARGIPGRPHRGRVRRKRTGPEEP